jgi:hypothetical protein
VVPTLTDAVAEIEPWSSRIFCNVIIRIFFNGKLLVASILQCYVSFLLDLIPEQPLTP